MVLLVYFVENESKDNNGIQKEYYSTCSKEIHFYECADSI